MYYTVHLRNETCNKQKANWIWYSSQCVSRFCYSVFADLSTGAFLYLSLNFIFHTNILHSVIPRFRVCSLRFFKQSFSLQIMIRLPPLLLFPQFRLFLLHQNFTVFSFMQHIKFLSHDVPSTLSICIHRSGLMALQEKWNKTLQLTWLVEHVDQLSSWLEHLVITVCIFCRQQCKYFTELWKLTFTQTCKKSLHLTIHISNLSSLDERHVIWSKALE